MTFSSKKHPALEQGLGPRELVNRARQKMNIFFGKNYSLIRSIPKSSQEKLTMIVCRSCGGQRKSTLEDIVETEIAIRSKSDQATTTSPRLQSDTASKYKNKLRIAIIWKLYKCFSKKLLGQLILIMFNGLYSVWLCITVFNFFLTVITIICMRFYMIFSSILLVVFLTTHSFSVNNSFSL